MHRLSRLAGISSVVICLSFLEIHCKESTTPNGPGLAPVPFPKSEFLMKLQFVDATTGWLLSTTFTIPYKLHLYHTEDGGNHWALQKTLDSTALGSLSFLNSSVGWLGLNSGILYYTTDGGYNWSRRDLDSTSFTISSVQPIGACDGWVTCSAG